MFLWPIISGLIFSSNAQYSAPLVGPSGGLGGSSGLGTNGGYCDSGRLLRCQQEAVRDMQLVGLNGASVQYPLGSGPPYSPAAKLREVQSAQATCRLVRSNLDCLLATTPACYESGLQAALNSEVILRAKRFLEQAGCNEPDASWQLALCYRAPEVRACEERYGFTVFGAASSATAALSSASNASACLAYQAFRACIVSHVRLNCKVPEIDMQNEYLIDRAGELAWRCPHFNSSGSLLSPSPSGLHYGGSSPYGLANGPTGQLLSPSNYAHHHQRDNYAEQRPIPTYAGSSSNANQNNLFTGVIREQPWERFKSPYEDTRYGISRLPSGGVGEVFDRLVGGGAGFEPETSDCPVKAAPFARECDDALMEQQRLARDARDGHELQRRICCSLLQHRDCISRVVLDRCSDSSPAAVDILMGARRRELFITCRNFNRDLCSGALSSLLGSSPLLVWAASLLAGLLTLRRQVCL